MAAPLVYAFLLSIVPHLGSAFYSDRKVTDAPCDTIRVTVSNNVSMFVADEPWWNFSMVAVVEPNSFSVSKVSATFLRYTVGLTYELVSECQNEGTSDTSIKTVKCDTMQTICNLNASGQCWITLSILTGQKRQVFKLLKVGTNMGQGPGDFLKPSACYAWADPLFKNDQPAFMFVTLQGQQNVCICCNESDITCTNFPFLTTPSEVAVTTTPAADISTTLEDTTVSAESSKSWRSTESVFSTSANAPSSFPTSQEHFTSTHLETTAEMSSTIALTEGISAELTSSISLTTQSASDNDGSSSDCTATAIDDPTSSMSSGSPSGTSQAPVQWTSSTTGFVAPSPSCNNCSKLADLANATIDSDTVGPILDSVQNILDTSPGITADDLYYTSLIFFDACKIESLQTRDFESLSVILDAILSADQEEFYKSNTRDLGTTNRFLDSIPLLFLHSPRRVTFTDGKNVALAGRDVDCSSSATNQIVGMTDRGSSFSVLPVDGTLRHGDVASITIPRDVACNSAAERLYFLVYRNPKLFVGEVADFSVVDEEVQSAKRCLDGPFLADRRIMTGTLVSKNTTISKFAVNNVSQHMAILRYSKYKIQQPLHGKFGISHFIESKDVWSSEYCDVTSSADYFESRCNHLTDFTLLIDGMVTDPTLCDSALQAFGYAISSLSVASLAVMALCYAVQLVGGTHKFKIIAFVLQRQPRGSDDPVGILYVFALFFFFVFFTFFTDELLVGTPCAVFAAITYTLLLSCIILMMFQSLKVLASFVRSVILENLLKRISNVYIVLLLGIGVPILISVVIAVTDRRFFTREDQFCWIRPDHIALAVILPFSFVVFNGFVCFVMILLRLFPHLCGRKTIPLQLTRTKSMQRLKIVTLMLIQFTLGIPWVLQYFTLFSGNVTAYHYLFTLVNGSQGTVLMLLFVFRTVMAHRLRRSVNESKRLYEQYERRQAAERTRSTESTTS